MENFFIPVIIVVLFLFLGIILVKSMCFPSRAENVEIVIYGDADEYSLEKLIISAKLISENHLTGARIYIQGGDEKTVGILCRRYGILRK